MLHSLVLKKKEEILTYLHWLWLDINIVNEISTLLLAFVHKSFVNDYYWDYQHNERLEFLWDWILWWIINSFLYMDFPNEEESQLTLRKIILVKENTLFLVAKNIWLWEKMFISNWEEKMWWRNKKSILSDWLEALIGAIFLSLGFSITKNFIKKYIYDKYIDEIISTQSKSYKNLVQEYFQKKYKKIPEYKDFPNKISKSNDIMEYKSEMRFNWKKMSEWIWKNKKKAQNNAAKFFYEKNILE